MCGRDRHQPPQPSAKALEAGFHLYEHPHNTSTATSSFSRASTSISSTSSSTTPAPSITKKRRWYKPELRLNLHEDWLWVGFIRAGPTTPAGTGPGQGQIGKEEDEEWEQLPAYAPQEERKREGMERIDENSRCEQEGWLVVPPNFEPGQGRRDAEGVDPPAYR